MSEERLLQDYLNDIIESITDACVLDFRLRGNDIFMFLCEPAAHERFNRF